MRIAIIGCGHMGRALVNGLLNSGISRQNLILIDPDAQIRAQLEQTLNLHCGAAPSAALRAVQALVLAVKPHTLADAARQIAPYLSAQLIISVAAGIRIATLTRWLSGYPRIVRAMPNLPVSIGLGITGLAALSNVQDHERAYAERILSSVGQIIWCQDESRLDALTALSGSGPAYVFYFIAALEDAARQLGFDNAQARMLAQATVMGATTLAAQSDTAASTLQARVSPPKGTTAAALTSFDTDRVKDAIVRGVLAAHRRALEIANQPDQR